MEKSKNYEDLESRWSFMCEGIEDQTILKNTMMVLENSANYMVDNDLVTEDVMQELLGEASSNPNVSPADGNSAIGTSTAGKVANYVVPKVMLPVIRRVMPQLIANELVSVQPINGKTGVVFYAEYQYSDAKGGVAANQAFTGNYPQDLAGNANANLKGQAFYSSQKCGPYTVTGDGSTTAFDIAEAYAASTMTLIGAEAYPDAGGAMVVPTVAYKAASGDFTGGFTVTFTTAPANDATYTVFMKYKQEASDKIPEMQFQILSKSVETVERKLKVRFTREAMQDLKAHFNLDLDSELVKMATIEMNYEIDREIIQSIDRTVPTELSFSHNWDFNGGTTSNNVWTPNAIYNYLDRHRALAQSIFSLSGKMAQYNRQGSANWAVVSPKVAALLMMLPEFQKEPMSANPNIYTIGSMNKIKYFVDPNRVGADEKTILLGFKSPISSFGAGIVYAPYANWMTPSIYDPNTFDENKGFFSRYAIVLVPRGQWFYAKLNITHLD